MLYERHRKMFLFLASFVQDKGRVPNYGSNDGSYLFPLSDYQDYRPSINFASAVNTQELLFKGSTQIVDFFGIEAKYKEPVKPLECNYPNGGYYQLKKGDLYCFIRCHTYNTRPAHSDALHLDIWIKGENIFCDSGTYSYNTDQEVRKKFMSIFGHNTVVVDDEDYLKPVLRFGTTNWPKGKVLFISDNEFCGEHYGYRNTSGIIHRRQVTLSDDCITVTDSISGINKMTSVSQNWHTEFSVLCENSHKFLVNNLLVTSNLPGIVKPSTISKYYCSHSDAQLLSFNTLTDKDLIIETKILK